MEELQTYYPLITSRIQSQELPVLQVRAKEIVKQSHQQCQGFPLLVKGILRISQILEDGEESFLYDLYPGDYCHEVMNCLIHHQSGRIQSMAFIDSTIYMVPSSLFTNVLLKEPVFLQSVYQDAVKKLHLMMKNNELKYMSVEERLLDYLLKQNSSVLYTTHKDIAFMLHSAREVISRKLKEYEQRGWISLKKGKILLLDKEALQTELGKVKR